MPLKDLDKLTVVKLRAELIARGLDSKGNKPFLVERLRIALEQEEQTGGVAPEIKMFSSTDAQSASGASDHDTSIEGESAEADLSSLAKSEETTPVVGSNGTAEGNF